MRGTVMKKWAFVGIVVAALLVWWWWGRRPQEPALSLNPAQVSSVVITTNGEIFPAGRIVVKDEQDVRDIASIICRAEEGFYPADGCMYSFSVKLVTPEGSQTAILAACCFGSLKISGDCRYHFRSEDRLPLRKVLAKYGFLWYPDRKP